MHIGGVGIDGIEKLIPSKDKSPLLTVLSLVGVDDMCMLLYLTKSDLEQHVLNDLMPMCIHVLTDSVFVSCRTALRFMANVILQFAQSPKMLQWL
jgi:hypothetical protein